ncbi:unnamed protein product [Urochloa decumbens]|uniref:TF-B3 domain-containing protein n=1 Tax=Urochloa decumbens TaxID=240449 RepID=A0ABC8VX19_9POAL
MQQERGQENSLPRSPSAYESCEIFVLCLSDGCGSCRKWQEHYYWEHMDVTKIRFFRLMTGDFTNGIIIPEKFVRSFNGQITEGIDLKTESGETWHVGVDKSGDELLLTSGWKDFVKAHELKENDLLIFKYSGNSSFDILIFEASGCEKLSSLFANRAGPNLHKHLNGTEGQNAEPYPLTDSEESSMPLPPQLVGSTHMASTSKKYNCKTKPRKEHQSLNSSSCHVKHEEIEEDESNDRYEDSKFYCSRNVNWLTEEEKENILKLAAIQPENPAFVAALRKSHRQRQNNFLGFEVDVLNLLLFVTVEVGYQSFLDATKKMPKCKTLSVLLFWDHHGLAPVILHLFRSCNSMRKLSLSLHNCGALEHSCPSSCPFCTEDSRRIDNIDLSSLEEVEISSSKISYEELEFVEVLSRCSATILKKLVINYRARATPEAKEICEKMDVEKRCDSCRKWQEHYYWEHMDVTMIRFFKLMTGDFTLGIIIPEKFVRNFNGKITEGVDLKAESGETWHVGVEKRDNELLLTSGWKDFVKAHELKENDLLIFTCRKEPQFLNSSCCHVKHEAVEEDESNDRHADSKFYYSRNANRLTEEEKENILSLASIQLENPEFVNVLQKSHRQRNINFMVIPSRFAADHLQGRTREIILSRPSRNGKWRVRYYYTSYTRGFQNLQFFRFVDDNKLREGDICVFELMKGAKRVTMAVRVIRKVGDRFVLEIRVNLVHSFEMTAWDGRRSGGPAVPHLSGPAVSTELTGDISSKLCSYPDILIRTQIHILSLTSRRGDLLHLGSSDSLGRCNKSMMDAEKGCESCRKWQEHYYWEHMDVTKIRFFRLMTGDFTNGIIIPEKIARNFNGQITEGVGLKAVSGETWHVGVDKSGDELLHTSGWKDFVKAHKLKENDLLIFTSSGNSSFDILSLKRVAARNCPPSFPTELVLICTNI